jgi:putative addiction module component (TIGR02574 family)
MKLADLPNVEALSATEKLQLLDEIWVSVAAEISHSEVSPEEKRLLEERWRGYERNPESALTLGELKRKIADSRK